MTYDRTIRTKLLWIVLLGAVMASCAGDGGESAERAYANDVLVDTEWIEAHMEDPSVRLLEVGRNANAFGEGHLPGCILSVHGGLVQPRRSHPRPDRDGGPGVGGPLGRTCRTGPDLGPVRPPEQSLGRQGLLGPEVLSTR